MDEGQIREIEVRSECTKAGKDRLGGLYIDRLIQRKEGQVWEVQDRSVDTKSGEQSVGGLYIDQYIQSQASQVWEVCISISIYKVRRAKCGRFKID